MDCSTVTANPMLLMLLLWWRRLMLLCLCLGLLLSMLLLLLVLMLLLLGLLATLLGHPHKLAVQKKGLGQAGAGSTARLGGCLSKQ